MPRAAERLLAKAKERMCRLRTLDDLRIEQRITAACRNSCGGRDFDTRLEPPGARDADVEILAFERVRIRRDQRDDVAESIVEVRELELRAIVRDALCEPGLDAA